MKKPVAGQGDSEKVELTVAVHEAGYAVARYLTADEMGYSPSEAIHRIEIADDMGPPNAIADGTRVFRSQGATHGPLFPREISSSGQSVLKPISDGATITYGDVYRREGTYRVGQPLKEGEGPLRIGGEGTGTVEAVGAEVKHVKAGDDVIFESPGAYAEYVAAPAARVVKVPKGIKPEDAASTLSIAGTAHYLSHDTVKLAPGMSCLVHAAAGGVGHILLQFAKLKGAQVLATVGNAAKAEFVRGLGADRAILYNDEDFLEVAKSWGDGKGLDAVYDSVGKTTIKKSIQAVRHRGTCVLYGNSSGLVESIAPMELSATGSIYFTRPRLAHHLRTPEEISRRADDVFDAVGSGRMKFALAKIFPLAQAADAHRLLQSRTTIGKILLSVE